MPKTQPLSYQHQLASCWITSVMNGLVYLLGPAKIPNIIARVMYSGMSNDGIKLDEAEDLVALINSHEVKVNCRVVSGGEVTKNLVARNLNKGAVIVADTLSGDRSVLLVAKHKKRYHLFDPDWEAVCAHSETASKKFRVVLDQPHHNVEVAADEFFNKKELEDRPFRMGAIIDRFVVIMSKTR